MEVTVKRDGLTLRGTLLKPEGIDKCPITVIFHGLMSDRANKRESMHSMLADKLLKVSRPCALTLTVTAKVTAIFRI